MIISQHRLTRLLIVITVVLAIAHVLAVVAYYREFIDGDGWIHIAFFDLDEEEGFGTWFSTMLLMAASLLLMLQTRTSRHEASRWSPWWLMLSFGFLILSIDEVIGIHEYVNTVVEDTRWTTFGFGIALLVAFAYLPFLRAMPPRTRNLFIVAGALYVGGAMGVEWGTDWYDDNDLLDTLEYNLWTAVEEILEISGVTLFVYALIGHLRDNGLPEISIKFTE